MAGGNLRGMLRNGGSLTFFWELTPAYMRRVLEIPLHFIMTSLAILTDYPYLNKSEQECLRRRK